MIHYTRVDWWLAALMGGISLIEFTAGTAVLVGGLLMKNHLPAVIVGPSLLAGGVLFGLILWALYRIRYEIASPDLLIACGPFRSRLPLESIVEVFPTRNPLSAPASSLDRLRINYQRNNGKLWFTLISPKDREAFVRDLASAAPQLQSAGDPLRLRAEEPV
jgi:hypothetical protein